MKEQRARELVAAERARIHAALDELGAGIRDDGALELQQTGESESGSDLASEMVDVAMIADLQAELEAVGRAEERISAGTFGVSVESGRRIPVARLEAAPLAERTLEEQRVHEDEGR